MLFKGYLADMYRKAEDLNTSNVMNSLQVTGPHSTLLDVGCWDGKATQDWVKSSKSNKIIGIEPITRDDVKKSAEKFGIEVHNLAADRDTWDISNNSVDCIVSNQVVEHLSDVDFYFREASRVLKPGGYIVTSTNNLSSLHNIISLICGFAPFDLSNSSSIQGGIGNPFAIHKGERDPRGSSWTHKCVYTVKWLKDWQSLYDLNYKFHLGAGLYPFPASLGKKIKLYSAFITVVAQKKS